VKFTKTKGVGRGPSGAEEPCVIYKVEGLCVRVQWPSLKEGGELEKHLRPHYWGDRRWQFALTFLEDGKTKLYGFAKDQAHVDALKEKASRDGVTDLTVLPLEA
jgi:hypothetical protein